MKKIVAIAVILAITFALSLPSEVTITPSGAVSLTNRVVFASPAFTARTETFARGSSLTTPFNFTINTAGGVVDNDIMFMFLMVYVASPPTIDSVPGGWTQVATNAAGNSRWYLYYKIASGEGASYIWSLTASCRYYALNIAYSSGDFDVASLSDITVSNTLYGTAGTIVRAATMNVPNANSPLVYFGAIYNTAVQTFTKPTVPTTGWIEDADQGHTTPDLSLTNGSMIWTDSGATGNMDIACSITITTNKHAFAVALNPSTACSPNISNAPTGRGFGVVSENSSYWSNNSTPTFPLDDGECYFTVTNNSGGSIDINIKATNFTGGDNWTLAGTVGENIVVMKAGKSSDNEVDLITLTVGDQLFVNSLANLASKKWEIKLETGTFTDGAEKTSTITLTAVCE